MQKKVQGDSPYQILDDILKCFNPISRNSVEYEELQREVNDISSINQEFFYPAYQKLVDEKYIEVTSYEMANMHGGINKHTDCSLTFEGVLLINDGGYVLMKKMETKDASRKDFYEFVVAVGTGLAGLYVIFQIIESVFSAIANILIIVHHP